MSDGEALRPDAGRPARGRPRLLHLLPVLAFVALAGLFAVRLVSGDPTRLPSALIGRPAPPFDLPALEGATASGRAVPGLSRTDLVGGRVSVVNVWASWCGPCRVEHPLLEEIARDPSLRLVGINYKDRPEPARRFLTELGNPFAAVGVDPSGRAGIDWGVYGVPETFIVGPDGTIRHKHVGPITSDMLPAFMERVRAAARP